MASVLVFRYPRRDKRADLHETIRRKGPVSQLCVRSVQTSELVGRASYNLYERGVNRPNPCEP